MANLQQNPPPGGPVNPPQQIIFAQTIASGPANGPNSGSKTKTRAWLRYTNLKVEAAIFLLIALTFAAVLGQGAITSRNFAITALTSQYYPYGYSDKDNGGHSSITFDKARSLTWTCTLKEGFSYPYCGYGLSFVATPDAKGQNFSSYQDIVLRLTYHGNGDHLKFIVKTRAAPALRAKLKGDDEMSLATEFDVVNGVNEIHLNAAQLVTERWWVDAHHLTPQEALPDFTDVTGIAIGTGTATPVGTAKITVQSIAFSGVTLSTEQWYLIILAVWLVATGVFLVYRFLGVRRDYETRQRQQAAESAMLAKAHAAAQAGSAAKSRFLANMTHELRTPLNAILGYAQLVKNNAVSDEQKCAAAQIIEHSGEHLLMVINDVLDMAKVEAGKLELLEQVLDIRSCVADVAAMMRLRAEDKGLTFDVAIGSDIPAHLRFDALRLRQVLINILGNAMKFTSSGGVKLELERLSDSDGLVWLRFSVTDTGIGIAEDDVGRLFQPFEQAGTAVARHGGTGLGLAISHQIVALMGGHISIESAPGQGSCFRIEVPFEGLPQTLAHEVSHSLETAPAIGTQCVAALSNHEMGCARDDLETVDRPAQTTPHGDDSATLDLPCPDTLARLLSFARAGNMRAIRSEVRVLRETGDGCTKFADELDALAATYQSPAVLQLIEACVNAKDAA